MDVGGDPSISTEGHGQTNYRPIAIAACATHAVHQPSQRASFACGAYRRVASRTPVDRHVRGRTEAFPVREWLHQCSTRRKPTITRGGSSGRPAQRGDGQVRRGPRHRASLRDEYPDGSTTKPPSRKYPGFGRKARRSFPAPDLHIYHNRPVVLGSPISGFDASQPVSLSGSANPQLAPRGCFPRSR